MLSRDEAARSSAEDDLVTQNKHLHRIHTLQTHIYSRRYESSAERLEELLPWTYQYNWHRPHSSLHDKNTHQPIRTRCKYLLLHHS